MTSNTDIKLIVTGPAGAGKTTIGRALADKLGIRYVDGDDLHSASNIEKMSKGTPLSDADRGPWIESILSELEQGSVVIGASLLKRNFRQKVATASRDVRFIQLTAPVSVLTKRIQDREHFFRQDLLASQLMILDRLGRAEPGHIYDANKPAGSVVAEIIRDLKVE